MTIHYPWHPWHGQQVHRDQTRKTIAGIDYFLVSRDGYVSRSLLPAWLFDAEFCRRCRIADSPSVSFRTLENLYDLLVAVPYAARIIKRRRLKSGDRHEENPSRRGKSALAESFRSAKENSASASRGRRRDDSASRTPVARHRSSNRDHGLQTGEGRS